MLDEFLKQLGINDYSELSEEEKKTYHQWLKALEQREVTLSDVKGYIRDMKYAVAEKLADTPESEKNANILLKGRLKNYILLEGFLTSADKARQQLEKHIGNLKGTSTILP